MADVRSHVRASRIDLASTPDFDLGGLRVRPARRQVCRDGDCRDLEPRVMQVLVALASARPELVSRDRLIEQCWDGRIVGDDSINRCILALRHLARETEPPAFTIETVPRVGYYLVEHQPAQIEAAIEDAVPPQPSHAPPDPAPRRWPKARWPLAALLVALLALGMLFLVLPERGGRADAAPTTIAVLPFRNLSSGDPYFAEGVAEEILGHLAREPQFRVAGRTSSSMFRDAADVREVGRKLDVAYVLEGSVRTAGDQVRVNVALLKASDGMRLWSETYAGTLGDIFAIQAKVGEAVAARLSGASARPAPPLSTRPDVYNLYLTARSLLRDRTASGTDAAVMLLRRAVKLDPAYWPAWANLGLGVGMQAMLTSEVAESGSKRGEALAHARRALALSRNASAANAIYGALLYQDDIASATAHLEEAAALNPSDAETWHWLSYAYDRLGEYPKSIDAARRAVQLDPFWRRAFMGGSNLVWDAGYRAEAELWRARGVAASPGQDMVAGERAALALLKNDYSSALGEARSALAVAPPPDRLAYESLIGSALLKLGYAEAARRNCPWLVSANEVRLRRGELPPDALAPPAEADRRRSRVAPERYLAFRLLVSQGRPAEVVRYYDRRFGSPAALSRHPDGHLAFLFDAAIFARALKAVNRGREADDMLRLASTSIDRHLRAGSVPRVYHLASAQVWAGQGRHAPALEALERTLQLGLSADHPATIEDVVSDPTFDDLRSNPAFQRWGQAFRGKLRRERAEAATYL